MWAKEEAFNANIVHWIPNELWNPESLCGIVPLPPNKWLEYYLANLGTNRLVLCQKCVLAIGLEGGEALSSNAAVKATVGTLLDYDFEALGASIGKLVREKNTAYGDSFLHSGEFLRLLYPNGVKLEQYDDMLTIVRVYDKLVRIATDQDAFGENPWQDEVGYGLLSIARREVSGR